MFLVEFFFSFEQTYHKVREAYQKWHKIDQKTKCLILRSLDNVLKKQHMSIAMVYDLFLKLQGLFGDKGKSIKQFSLKTIMNTMIHVILKILPDSFGMGKKILKE